MNVRLGGIISPDILISAYRQGFFPMAEPNSREIYWHSPANRAIIPLETKVPRTVRQLFKRNVFHFTVNSCFRRVIVECSLRPDTWISDEIINSYVTLNEKGYAFSVEAWHEDELAGGLYGVAIGGAFFGESMFTLIDNASKAAFFYLKKRLISRGFVLLDSQYLNPHTQTLGAIEIPKSEYLARLRLAISMECKFD